MGTQQKVAIYEPGSGFSSEILLAGTLILDFLASGTVGNKYVLFISHLVYGILLQ